MVQLKSKFFSEFFLLNVMPSKKIPNPNLYPSLTHEALLISSYLEFFPIGYKVCVQNLGLAVFIEVMMGRPVHTAFFLPRNGLMIVTGYKIHWFAANRCGNSLSFSKCNVGGNFYWSRLLLLYLSRHFNVIGHCFSGEKLKVQPHKFSSAWGLRDKLLLDLFLRLHKIRL